MKSAISFPVRKQPLAVTVQGASKKAIGHLKALIETSAKFELDNFTISRKTAIQLLALAEFGYRNAYPMEDE